MASEHRDQTRRTPHLLALDGLRGFALLLVVLYHVLVTNEHAGSSALMALAAIRRSLWIGVDLFIALSGFLITGILFDSLGRRHFLRSFYARRCLRILPVYWLAILVLTGLAYRYHVSWLRAAGLLFAFLQNTPVWFRHPPAFPLDAFTSHLWSIALEEQFYVCWPLLVLLLRKRRRLMTCSLLLSGVALLCRLWLVHRGVAFDVTYKMLPCRMDGFLLGGWLALAIRQDSPTETTGTYGESHASLPMLRYAPVVFAAAACVLLFAGLREHGLDWHESRFVNGPGYTAIALLCTSLLAWSLRAGSLPQIVFQTHFLRLLGRYSYGIYVWHLLLGQAITHPARVLAAHVSHSAAFQMLLGAAVTCGYSLLLGVLSFHAVEVHFLRLRRKYEPERTPQSTGSELSSSSSA